MPGTLIVEVDALIKLLINLNSYCLVNICVTIKVPTSAAVLQFSYTV